MMTLYSVLLSAGLLVSSPWLVFRMATTRRYREGLRERLGRVPSRLRKAVQGRQVVWVHAVSVGEVLAAAQMITDLERTLNGSVGAEGSWRVVISTTTKTGQELARERFGKDRVFWFPLDFGWAVRAWLRVLRPRLLVLMESELWPRLLSECSRVGIPVAVANARLSDRSFRRARRVRRLWGRVLRHVNLFLAQSEETAGRLRGLGVAESAVQMTGNLKYDSEPRETEMVQRLRPLLGQRSLVVAGSLLEPEETLLLKVWRQVCRTVPQSVLVLAPRHPERFHTVARRAAAAFPLLRGSTLLQADHGTRPVLVDQCGVVMLDSVGDLAALYALADVAFVGGSLVPRGGHNPLEPARFGVPVIMGPSFENFRDIVREMQAAKGIEIVHNELELQRALARLMGDRVEADALGLRGQEVFARRSGATGRTVSALVTLIGRRKMAGAVEEATR